MGRDLHPALDPPQHGRALVVLEIMAGAGAQLDQDVMEQLFGERRVTLGHGGERLQVRVVGGGQADFL